MPWSLKQWKCQSQKCLSKSGWRRWGCKHSLYRHNTKAHPPHRLQDRSQLPFHCVNLGQIWHCVNNYGSGSLNQPFQPFCFYWNVAFTWITRWCDYCANLLSWLQSNIVIVTVDLQDRNNWDDVWNILIGGWVFQKPRSGYFFLPHPKKLHCCLLNGVAENGIYITEVLSGPISLQKAKRNNIAGYFRVDAFSPKQTKWDFTLVNAKYRQCLVICNSKSFSYIQICGGEGGMFVCSFLFAELLLQSNRNNVYTVFLLLPLCLWCGLLCILRNNLSKVRQHGRAVGKD